jgi:hypothetical protein
MRPFSCKTGEQNPQKRPGTCLGAEAAALPIAGTKTSSLQQNVCCELIVPIRVLEEHGDLEAPRQTVSASLPERFAPEAGYRPIPNSQRRSWRLT